MDPITFDVVIVGAGPAGLTAACHIAQLSQQKDQAISICVVEKGAEVGAHILSGAILDTRALEELFPDWQARGAPLHTPVTEDEFWFYYSQRHAIRLPNWLIPKASRNNTHDKKNRYIVSMADVCRWLAEQAEALGVEIYPGTAVADIWYDDNGAVQGIITGAKGVDKAGKHKKSYVPGMPIQAKYTLFCEGSRGHLGKQLIAQYNLDKECDPQNYAIGFKEIWNVSDKQHQLGLAIHGLGWPLQESRTAGGGFLYHAGDNQIFVGLVVDLNYRNPHLNPFAEFQRFKTHPRIAQYLQGGKRVAYGARAITKGGLNALPRMHFPGGLLLGCDAGTLNGLKIKGNHMAMKSGLLAAQEVVASLLDNDGKVRDLAHFAQRVKRSWLYQELYQSRNFCSFMHRYNAFWAAAAIWIEQTLWHDRLSYTLHNQALDDQQLKLAVDCPLIDYPKPDGKLSFDLPSSVFLSGVHHQEDQPCHLHLLDAELPITHNQPLYDEPAQRYCPAGVYEVLSDGHRGKRFQINASNCIHCKTCDIKDPSQNIIWCPPEGGDGPNYSNM